MLPLFKRAENNERGADGFHGDEGPLSVSNMRIQRPICDAWVAAAQTAGYAFNPDYNGATQEGVGYFQLTTKQRPAMQRSRRLPEPDPEPSKPDNRHQGTGRPGSNLEGKRAVTA